jgi:hypothetical protein
VSSIVAQSRNAAVNYVFLFPKPPREPGTSTIICQIGSEHFAIHMRVEDLPPRASAGGDDEAKGQEGSFQECEVVQKTMRMETKFLRLRTPVERYFRGISAGLPEKSARAR